MRLLKYLTLLAIATIPLSLVDRKKPLRRGFAVESEDIFMGELTTDPD